MLTALLVVILLSFWFCMRLLSEETYKYEVATLCYIQIFCRYTCKPCVLNNFSKYAYKFLVREIMVPGEIHCTVESWSRFPQNDFRFTQNLFYYFFWLFCLQIKLQTFWKMQRMKICFLINTKIIKL